MSQMLSVVICAVFVVLAFWHFYMALRPKPGSGGAVPSVGGKPLFVPSRGATVAVGVALLAFAALVADTGGIVSLGLPATARKWLCYALASGLLARAVGDFRHVGFFKRNRGSRFAKLDSWVYSPLCLLLAAGVALVASQPTILLAPWLQLKIAQYRQLPPANPPRSILQTTYEGKKAYFIPRACCDIPSELYNEGGTLICFPDGGFAGGDGKCPKFTLEGNAPTLVWHDDRKPAPAPEPAKN